MGAARKDYCHCNAPPVLPKLSPVPASDAPPALPKLPLYSAKTPGNLPQAGLCFQLVVAMAGNGLLPSGRRRQAVVVGCGPAGSLMAIYLARMGWQVEAYELRSDYHTRVARGGIDQRAYDIFLDARGLGAIRDAGAEIGPDVGVQLDGVVLHGGRMGKAMKVKFVAALTVVNRDALSNALQEQGTMAHAGLTRYIFDYRLVGVEFDEKMVHFERAGMEGTKGMVSRRYDLLVGADGAWSCVRREMKRAGLVTFRQERNAGGSRMLGTLDDLVGADEDWRRYWHLWLRHGPGLVMDATPMPDGRYRIGFGVMTDKDCTQILNLKSEERLEEIVRSKFPDLFKGKPMPEGLARNLVEQEANHNGVETACSTFHARDCVVLVGDAAHSMFPNQGQGCNAALESCEVLAGLIAANGGDLSKALPAFTEARKRDTDAAAIISRRPFLTVWTFVKEGIMQTLHRFLPVWFSESASSQLTKNKLSYSAALSLEQWQDKQLMMLLVAMVGLVAIALRRH